MLGKSAKNGTLKERSNHVIVSEVERKIFTIRDPLLTENLFDFSREFTREILDLRLTFTFEHDTCQRFCA